jgi:hypothetical protein
MRNVQKGGRYQTSQSSHTRPGDNDPRLGRRHIAERSDVSDAQESNQKKRSHLAEVISSTKLFCARPTVPLTTGWSGTSLLTIAIASVHTQWMPQRRMFLFVSFPPPTC